MTLEEMCACVCAHCMLRDLLHMHHTHCKTAICKTASWLCVCGEVVVSFDRNYGWKLWGSCIVGIVWASVLNWAVKTLCWLVNGIWVARFRDYFLNVTIFSTFDVEKWPEYIFLNLVWNIFFLSKKKCFKAFKNHAVNFEYLTLDWGSNL